MEWDDMLKPTNRLYVVQEPIVANRLEQTEKKRRVRDQWRSSRTGADPDVVNFLLISLGINASSCRSLPLLFICWHRWWFQFHVEYVVRTTHGRGHGKSPDIGGRWLGVQGIPEKVNASMASCWQYEEEWRMMNDGRIRDEEGVERRNC